jgi:RNA polymerase sigma-70 factor (ECF subfamily)
LKNGENDVVKLVRRAQDGDEQAMSELITIHKVLVYTIIFRMVSDAELSKDLTQETFIRFFLKIDKVKYAEKTRAWICRIARNIVYDHFRKEKRKKTVPLDEIPETSGKSNIEKRHKKMIIQDAMQRLKERDRMLLTMAYYEGFSLAEIAETMQISMNNAKVRLHRARLRLRDELEVHKDELLSAR